MDVGRVIQNNTVWMTPIISIILTIIIKISAKPEFMTLGPTDYLDFGFDLLISATIVLLAGTCYFAFTDEQVLIIEN